MTVQELANYAEIAGALMIIGGVIFALFQISEFRKQRHEAVAAELMRTFYNPDLANAVTLIRALPDHVPAEELRAGGPELERAAVLVSMTLETMGLLVFHRITPFNLVQELAGGMIVVMARKLSSWLETVREEQAQPSWAEWFQWLAALLESSNDESTPAYVKHRDWQP